MVCSLVNLCHVQFFWSARRTIHKQKSYKNQKCMSVILKFCLSSVWNELPAYIRLCGGSERLLKIANWTTNLQQCFLTDWQHCSKKYHKNERHLRLVTHIFSKLSQNVCLFNTHILIYWHARCNLLFDEKLECRIQKYTTVTIYSYVRPIFCTLLIDCPVLEPTHAPKNRGWWFYMHGKFNLFSIFINFSTIFILLYDIFHKNNYAAFANICI